jgi:DNA (cytosine-5)-methyltransferase 1
MRKVFYIDLFAGAGGLSEGFSACGYTPIAHVEMNNDACSTLRTRACFYYLKDNNRIEEYYDYLKGKITREELYKRVPEWIIDSVINKTLCRESMPSVYEMINRSMDENHCNKVDILLGGPPCQAYSLVGRARKDMGKDSRNTLYKLYLQVLEKYQPKMFVFENVPGILTAGGGKYFKDILKQFKNAGYLVEVNRVNASDFGVLQNRRRIILIGIKKNSGFQPPKLHAYETKYTVNNLLEDLPDLIPGESSSHYKKNKIGKYLLEAGIRSDKDVLTWHVTRPNLERDREIYRIAIKRWNDGHKRLKYDELPENLTTHKNKSCFSDRFKVVEGDLPACHTMMAHISKDGHYYIHPDINQARSLSVREAARIQSFPDNFFFEGSRTSAFMQIGNAVPPLLSRAIAIEIKKQFERKL